MSNLIDIFYENPLVSKCKLLKQWVNDTDIDDYFDCTYGYFDYKIMNGLLYILNNFKYNEIIQMIKIDNEKDREQLFILQYINYGTESVSKTYNECLLIQIENISKLYDLLISSKYPSFTNFYSDKIYKLSNKDLCLYRGFSGNTNIYIDLIESRFTVRKGSTTVITTPFFLSTSVVKYVAIRFVDPRHDIPIEKKILWKIIVPNRFLNTFKYIYYDKGINLDEINENDSFTENELLLNIGAKLKLISITQEIDQIYHYNGSNRKKSYTLYTYEFIGWSRTYITNLHNKLEFFKEALNNDKIDANSPSNKSLTDISDKKEVHKTKRVKSS